MQTGAEKHPECSTGAPGYDGARPTAFGRESGLTNPRPDIGRGNIDRPALPGRFDRNRCTVLSADDKEPLLARRDDIFYCGGWPDERAADNLVTMLCDRAHVETARMPEGVRRQQRGRTRIYANCSTEPTDLGALEPDADFLLDGQIIPPAGVSAVISDHPAGPA